MPYNEYPTQAQLYYDIALDNIKDGKIMTAISHLNMARAIAVKNNMTELINKIDRLLYQYDK